MPPRKIKRDPEAIESLKPLETYIGEVLGELEEHLLTVAKETAENETERILASIPEEFLNMKLTDFLTSQPPIDLFAQLQIRNKSPEPIEEEPEPKPVKESEEKENEPMKHRKKVVEPEPEPASEEHGEDMDTDDAAHETSIPFVHSGHNSGRNTATDSSRHELITPAGHVLTVPQAIYPKIPDGAPVKAFRRPHLNEEIAFSVNGSPMMLRESRSDNRAEALKGNLVPKPEPGTAV